MYKKIPFRVLTAEFQSVQAKVSLEKGKECCEDCSVNSGEPTKYTKVNSASIKGNIRVSAGDVNIEGDTYIGGVAKISGSAKINAVGETKGFRIKGSASGKRTKCPGGTCASIRRNVGGSIILGPTANTSVTVERCFLGYNCNIVAEGEQSAEATIESNMSASDKLSIGGACTEACAFAEVGAVKATASIGYELTAGSIFIKDDLSVGGTYPENGQPLVSGRKCL